MYFGFDNITISYGKKSVLQQVSLSFPKGSITTILGPNGCGKSSLLKTVFRTVRPAEGQVVLEGRPLGDYPVKFLAKKIAYLPQDHVSPGDIDVQTLVSYGRYPHQKPGRGLSAEDRRIVEESLALTGLTELGDRRLESLSGGERQRAWLAMAICQQPEILLLDEPITHLDVGYQLEVLELVSKLRDKLQLTVVMVLHDMNFAVRYSDWIYVLKDRRVFAQGAPETVISRDTMGQVFGVETVILRDGENGRPWVLPQRRIREDAGEQGARE